MNKEHSGLKRTKQQMPSFVKDALVERELMEAYNARPAYQRNDYLSWLARAKRENTRQRRLSQMLAELEAGGVYMNMKHAPSAKKS